MYAGGRMCLMCCGDVFGVLITRGNLAKTSYAPLIPRGDFTRVNHVGLAATEGLAVGPEVGVGAEREDFGWVDGTFGIVGAGRSGLKWVSASTAATSMRSSSAVKNEFSSENWTSNGESFIAREGVRVVVIGASVDLIIAVIFIKN